MAAPADPIALLIRATEERTRAEERTQAMLGRITADFESLRELIRSCDIPGLQRVVTRLEGGMNIIVGYLQRDAEKLGEYRDMAQKKMEQGGISVGGDIKAETVQIAGHDAVLRMAAGNPEAEKLVGEIVDKRKQGLPVDDLLEKLFRIAPDVFKLLVAVLTK